MGDSTQESSGLALRPTSTQEIYALTSLRGLAALWVVLFHVRDLTQGTLPEQRTLEPLTVSGALAVPLFFVLSGYVLGLSYFETLRHPSFADVRRFLAMRLGRIYPVHFAMIVAFAVVFLRHGWPDAFSKGSLLANLLLVHAWTRDGALS